MRYWSRPEEVVKTIEKNIKAWQQNNSRNKCNKRDEKEYATSCILDFFIVIQQGPCKAKNK